MANYRKYQCRKGHKHPTTREAIECDIDNQEAQR